MANTTPSGPDLVSFLEFCEIRPGSVEKDWLIVQQKLGGDPPILSGWGMRTLRDGLGTHVRTVLVEPFYICKDHRNLYSSFYSKKFHPPSPFCSRLHFFKTAPPKSVNEFKYNPRPLQDAYMGYSVIRPVPDRCLGRTVINPDSIGMEIGNKAFCLRTAFKVHIGGIEFALEGYPYVSQDADATVCAHSALWSVCRYFSERYPCYREILPFDLVLMTGKSEGRTFPYRGMTYEDYSTILSQFGVHPVVLRTKRSHSDTTLDKERWKDVCSYVESGFPVLASLYPLDKGGGHVVALVGHTSDFSRQLPTGEEFVDSSAFFDHLVVVDDNFFPYQLLGYSTDPANYAKDYRQEYSIDSILTAVCPLPEKAFMPADIARDTCDRLLKQTDIRSRLDKISKPPWICRLLMTTGSAFRSAKLAEARKLGLASYSDNADFIVSCMNLPHFVWIMQMAPVDAYTKRLMATVEIVVDATAGIYEKSSLYMRIGNELLPNVRVEPQGAGKRAASTATVCRGSAVEFPLYRHNLGTVKRRDAQ